MPARVRSERTSLSNCANAASTPSISLPLDVSSIGSVADRSEIPRDWRCARSAKWSYFSRAKRVRFVRPLSGVQISQDGSPGERRLCRRTVLPTMHCERSRCAQLTSVQIRLRGSEENALDAVPCGRRPDARSVGPFTRRPSGSRDPTRRPRAGSQARVPGVPAGPQPRTTSAERRSCRRSKRAPSSTVSCWQSRAGSRNSRSG